MEDNYILRAFFDAPRSILGGIFLFLLAVVSGQVLVGFVTDGHCDGVFGFLMEMLFTFGFGMMSVIGFVFLAIDFWFIYRLMYKDESAYTFFFVIAANQVALEMCASLILGDALAVWLKGAVALLLWGAVYWMINKLVIKQSLRS